MNTLMQVLAAVTPPTPGATAAPASTVDIGIGRQGQWFGPTVVLLAALILDWSALGSHSIRDRIASSGTYAATVSAIAIMGWASGIQSQFHGYNWQLAGSALCTIAHAAWVLALVGVRIERCAALAKKIAKAFHMEHKDSSANRINITLHVWSSGAALTTVLARGPSIWAPHAVATVVTSVWAWTGGAIVAYLGG